MLSRSMTKFRAQLLLTHGAGASCQSNFIQQLHQGLQHLGIRVHLFDFDYMRQRAITQRKGVPPPVDVLIPELAKAIAACNTDLPLFVGGKSMGGRVASLLAASAQLSDAVRGVVVYGYPFHPPRKDTWRITHFSAVRVPLTIIQGERDPFGSYAEIAALSWPMIRLNWLATADHDFVPLKRSGFTQNRLISQAADLTKEAIDAVISKAF